MLRRWGLWLLLLAAPAWAKGPTLAAVEARGLLRCGVSPQLLGFSAQGVSCSTRCP